nr:ATP/GTP-binding protein [uncultured Deinococcus sp.]
MHPIKIVVSGAVGAGKTTLIQTLSETEVISTDVVASEDIGKDNTTIAFDFGTVQLGDDLLLLFGTPGQERFDFMWDVLCQGAMGLLLLVSGTRPGDFRHSRHILEFIRTRYPLPYLLGVTHQDRPGAWAPEDVAEYFDTPPGRVIGLDATDPAACRRAVSDLLTILATPAMADVPPVPALYPVQPPEAL